MKRAILHFVLVVVLVGCGLLFPLRACATLTLHSLHHTSFGPKDGLLGQVKAVAQTTDGFLWVGTTEGLYRYDGVVFEDYAPPEGDLPDTAVTALLGTPDGALWVGFEHGAIARISQGRLALYTEQNGYPYGTTRAIVRGPDGAIWASVIGSLVRFDGFHWEKIRQEWNYPDRSARGLFVDRQGTLWVGTSERLVYLPAGSRKFIEFGFRGAKIVSFAQTQDGTLWLSEALTDTVQSFCSPLEIQTCNKKTPLKIHIGSWSLLAPKLGGMWFATETRGVRMLPDAELVDTSRHMPAEVSAEAFEQKDGLSASYSFCFLEDLQGDVWVGTKAGLDLFRRSRLEWHSVGVGEQQLLFGDNGLPWIGTSMDPVPPGTPVQIDRRLPDAIRPHLQSLSSAFRDDEGDLWLANAIDLYRWSKGHLSSIPRPSSAPDGFIYSISGRGEHTGGIWFSIAGHGEYRYLEGSWTFFPVPGAEPDIAAISTYIDDRQRVWLAYDARQIVSAIEPGKTKSYGATDGLQIGHPYVVRGRGQEVWVGGSRGLAYFKDGRFHSLKDVLGSKPSIFGIVFSPNRDAWLSTAKGMVRLSADDMDRCLKTACDSMRFNISEINRDSPEVPVRPNYLGTPAVSLVDPAGRLWFATGSGVASVDLESLRPISQPLPVVVRSVVMDGESYVSTSNLTRVAHVRNLRITFTSPSIASSDGIYYLYRLANWETSWQNSGAAREVSYANLQPGDYTFEITACNAANVCSKTARLLDLTIKPTFWQTVWFKVALACGLAFVFWLLYRLRIRQVLLRSNEILMERSAERERIAENLHDTLLQNLQGLILRFSAASKKMSVEDPIRRDLERVLSQSDLIMSEGRRLVSSLYTRSERAEDFIDSLKSIGFALQEAHEGEFFIDIQGDLCELRSVVCEEATAFANEALTNAFRHSRASRVWLVIQYLPRRFTLEVRDNGGGIPSEILSTGHRPGHFGLRGLKERPKRLGGIVSISSSPKNGTCVEMSVPSELAYAHSEATGATQLSSIWRARKR